MKIYWTLRNIPELSSVTAQERKRRWKQAYRSTFHHWETWVGLILSSVFGGIGAYYHQSLGTLIGGFIGGFVYSQVSIWVARKYYRHFLLGLWS